MDGISYIHYLDLYHTKYNNIGNFAYIYVHNRIKHYMLRPQAVTGNSESVYGATQRKFQR